jgi:hypothetical protein
MKVPHQSVCPEQLRLQHSSHLLLCRVKSSVDDLIIVVLVLPPAHTIQDYFIFQISHQHINITMSAFTKLYGHTCFSDATSRQMSNTMTYNCKAFNVTKAAPYVFNVELNRPKKMNAINKGMTLKEVFNKLDRAQECRVVILSAAGKMFSSGIDSSDLSQLASIVYS